MGKESLSIWQQVLSMHREWSNFIVLTRSNTFVCWEGQLQPLNQIYTVHVCLTRKRVHNNGIRTIPTVIVIKPELRRRSEESNSPIPHIYKNQNDPQLPLLCLYDPDKFEWNSNLKVAKTVIPWTIDWLACYEGWLATGEWAGGGRHPTPDEN